MKELCQHALPKVELRNDKYFYLDGTKIRGVRAYQIKGERLSNAIPACVLTLEILVDPELLIDNANNDLGSNITNDV